MSFQPQDIDLVPETDRPGAFGFFATSIDVSERLSVGDRVRVTDIQWQARIDLPIWSGSHLETVSFSAGVPTDSLTAEVLPNELGRTDGGDTDTLPDCLKEANLFRYELRQTSTRLELSEAELADQLSNRLVRVHDIAFAHALALRMEDTPVVVNAGRRAEPSDAIAILDDELMNRGIYGGVIHVPGFLSARVKADLDSDRRTWNGTQIHFMPSTTLATEGAVYATAPVHYAMDIDRVSVMPGSGDAVGQGVPTVSGDPHVSRNNLFAAGVFHGVVAFDGPALITQSHTLSTLTTAV